MFDKEAVIKKIAEKVLSCTQGDGVLATVQKRAAVAPPGEKTAAEIADAVLVKVGFSVTEEGHQWDADRSAAKQKYLLELAQMMQEKGGLGYKDEEGGRNYGNLLKALRFGSGDVAGHPAEALRREAYIEKKHRAGKNAWNPFGGTLTPHESEGEGATRFSAGKIE